MQFDGANGTAGTGNAVYWDVLFFYTIDGTNSQSSSAAELALHSGDKIEVSFGTLVNQ